MVLKRFKHIKDRRSSSSTESRNTPTAFLEKLEPRILLSGDGLLSSAAPEPLIDVTSPVVLHAESLAASEPIEQQPLKDEQIDQDIRPSEMVETHLLEPILTLSFEDNHEAGDGEPEDEAVISIEGSIERADEPVIDELHLAPASGTLFELQEDSKTDIDNETTGTEIVKIAVEKPTMTDPVELVEDGSKPTDLNDTNPISTYASPIDIRGPPGDQITGTVTISIPDIEMKPVAVDTTVFTQLSLPGWVSTNQVGRPELPTLRCFFEVPPGKQADLQILPRQHVSLGEGYTVYPVQPPPAEGHSEEPPFAYDDAFYEGTSIAGDRYELDSLVIRGHQIISAELTPFAFDPVTGEITAVTEFDVVLTFTGQEDAEARADLERLRSPFFDAVVSDLVENPLLGEMESQSGRDYEGLPQGASYLIITADSFYEEVLPLAEWKQLKGFPADVAKLSEIGGNTSTAIAAYIQNAYDTWQLAPSYVVLVGDHDDLASNSIGGSYPMISDQPYACVDGTDYFPDLTIARLTVHTEEEATAVVNKILTYDRNPDLGGWYDDALIAAYLQGPPEADRFFMETAMHVYQYLQNEQGMTMHNALTTPDLTYPTYYYRADTPSWYPHRLDIVNRYEPFATSTTPPYPVPSWISDMFVSASTSTTQITDAINNGVGLVQHRDHGGVTGWSDPPYYVANVNALSNVARTPVVFSTNCLTGTFNYSGGDCFCEAFLEHPNGGAVGIAGATRVSYSGHNDLLVHGTFTSFWSDYDPTHGGNIYSYSMRPGEALNFGKYYMYTYEGNSGTTEAEFNMFHWFGDPEMMLRTTTPQGLTVSFNPSIPFGIPTDLTIDVNIVGVPVDGALVCLSLPGTNDYWTGTTDASGSVTLAGITANHIENYNIVVTALNADPYEGTIQVIPEGPFAQLHEPAHGSLTNTDLGYVEIEWIDYFGLVGINTATIDADDIWIAGVTIETPIDQGSGIWRYPYTGSLSEGEVDVQVIAGQVQDNAGDWNVGQNFSFVYDAHSPEGTLSDPASGDTIYQDVGYVDIFWADIGPAGLDPSTLDSNDITITGVTVDGPPISLGSGHYRYSYLADLPIGTITVAFVPGEIGDLAGNVNAGHDETFVYDPLMITTPPVLPQGTLGTPCSIFIEADGGVEPYAWSSLDSDLICWWTFDEGTGTTAFDYSSHDYAGTVNGATWVADGRIGGALEFGGDGDYVVNNNIQDHLNGLSSVTICAWIKSDLINTNKGFINGEEPDGGDNVCTMRYDASGTMFGGSNILKMAVTSTPGGEQQLESSSNLQTTQWQHVAMTWSDGGLIRFYVNGVEDAPSGRNGIYNAGTISGCTKLIVGKGAKDVGLTAGWDGLIDDVRIYADVLSAEEIQQVMNSDILPPGLVLDSTTGQISGTPIQPGMYEFTIFVVDSHDPVNQASQTFTLEVNGPYAQFHDPAAGSIINIDPGHVDIQWLDHPGVGINTATIDAGDISISGVTIDTPTYQGSGIWRYPYTGTLSEGQVDVQVNAGQVQDNAGIWNVEQVFSFVYDTQSPTGTLQNPVNGATIYQDEGYVDVSWVDVGPAGVDVSTLDSNDITITGVTIDGPPTLLGPDTYRYSYSGNLPLGIVTVTFVPGEVADLAGNVNTGHDESFVYDPLVITTPPSLAPINLGAPSSIFIEVDGGVTPYTWSEASGGILITEINPGSPDTVEFTNVSGGDIDVSGWQIYIYDWDFHPTPQAPFTLPAGSVCLAEQRFTLDDLSGSFPGTFPNFHTSGNINWSSGSWIGVLLTDSMGQAVDFMAADMLDPTTITDPVTIVPDHWTGSSVLSIPGYEVTYQRVGNTDNNNATDWAHQAPSIGLVNTGLILPFPGENVLPPGLSLDNATGQISGTPIQTGTFEFTIIVFDSHDPVNQTSKTFTLDVVGPFAQLLDPAVGSITNINPGTIDIEWLDYPGVGINNATIDAGDISIAGVTIGTPIDQGGGIWRYPYSGTPSEGQVDILVNAGEVQDNSGHWNIEQLFSFVYDTQSPTGTLHDPANGTTVYEDRGYVDISWADVGLADIDTSTLDSNDITITGVTVDGPPTLQDADAYIYRYSYSGDLLFGKVTVTFVPSEVADLAGNVNAGHEESFINIIPATFFLADFEGDPPGAYSNDGFWYSDDFSAPGTNLWHGTYRRAHSSPYSQYYGLDGPLHYNTGARNAGNLLSPEISLLNITAPIELSFMYFLETESLPGWDIASVWISNDNGGNWTELANNQNGGLIDPTPGWTSWKGDLSSYVGDDILLKFNFDTIDGIANNFDGWFIDDVEITGLYESEIQGCVWNDQDGDGIRDEGEPGLTDWTVYLDDNNNGQLDPGERFEQTDTNGDYAFINMPPGTHTVAEQLQSCWEQTHPGGVGTHTVTINLGMTATDIDFGNQPIGEIHGYKWNDLNQDGVWDFDEVALADWTIYLDMNGNSQLDAEEPSTTTDGTGHYSFTNLAPDSYIVREVLQSQWKQSYPAGGAHTIQVGPDVVIENVNFGNIAYVVFNDLNLKAAVEEALGITNPTGSEMLALEALITGFQNIEDLTGLEYAQNLEYLMLWANDISDISLLLSLPNLKQLILSDNEITEFDPPTVWNNLIGLYLGDNQISTLPSLAGLTNIETLDLNGNNISAISTLTELTSLTYLDLRNNPLNPEAYSSHLAQIQLNNPGIELLYDPQPKGKIRGTVWNDVDGDAFRDQDEAGLEGWTVYDDRNSNGQLDPGEVSTTTNPDGSYELANLYPGTCIVTEIILPDWGQTYPGGSGTHTVLLVPDAIVAGIDFGNGYNEAPNIGSLSLTPDPIMYGEELTLTAQDVTDDHGVASVAFYRDDNTNGIGEPGELLGTDSNGADGWSWSGAVTWGPGDYSYLAQATDDGIPVGTKTSGWVSITGTVREVLTITTETPLQQAGFECSYSTFIETSGGIEPNTWSFYIDPSGNYIETQADSGTPDSSSAGNPMGWSADDASYELQLPWAFNFYGTEYNSVWVSTNGFLDFTSPAMTYSNSIKGLKNAVRIAPLWDDLTTDDGDIYVDFTMPDVDVFIRWEGHTYQDDHPVNFSVALSPNGRIRFDYYIEHEGLTPTIGLSAGNGSQYTLSYRDGAATIEADEFSEFAIPGSDPLPQGLSLNRTTGEISGVPTELGSFDFTVVVKDSSTPANQASKAFHLDVITIPDLVGAYCNAIPDLVGWGESFDVNYIVLNQGSAEAGAFEIGFYLSEDTDYDMGVDSFLTAVPVSPLAAGALTSGTATVTLPSSSPFTAQTGTFYVVMFSDDLDEVAESDETNNHGTGYQIDYDDFAVLPDLVGTYCNVIPDLIGWGDTFNIDYTVLNQGTADTGAFDIGFYLSEDTDYDMGVDSFLTGISVSQLAAGVSTSGIATATLPSSSPFTAQTGTFYVVMFSDDLNEVVESDETNNHGTGYQIDYDDFVVLPDLVGTYCNVVPELIGWDESFDVDYAVLNQGSADAGAFDIGFYLSEDTNYDMGVDSFLSSVSVSQLAAGASTSGTATVTLPSSSPFTAQTGTFYVVMFSDDLNEVVEVDETNNHSMGYQVDSDDFAVLPDLVGTYCNVIPDLTDWGESFDVDYTVLNQGSADTGAFDIGFYLSEDTDYDMGVDSFLTAVSVLQLTAGASTSGTATVTLSSSSPFAAQTGTFYVVMFSDDLEEVAEFDETNNHSTGYQIDYDEFDIVVMTTPSSLPPSTLGLPYSVILEAEGGTEPYTWSFKAKGDYEETDPGPGSVGGGTAMDWRADDASFELALPWTFDFYDTSYNSVWVCTNGFMDFTSSTTDFSNSQAELIDSVRIAPLWDDLTTSDGDIYVNTTNPDAVVIRWAGKTLSGENPVDFMVTLNKDGAIRFDYGNFHSGLTPTIGLSAGDGTYYTLSIRDGTSSIPANVASLFSVTGSPLPPGLLLNVTTGEISGVPTEIGTYEFTIVVTDSDTPANKINKDFLLEVRSPDLIGTQCNVIPDVVDWGESFGLNYAVLNQGTADAGAFDIGFYLSEDTDYDMGVDSFLTSVSVSQLAAGVSTSGTATVTLPSSSPFTTQTGIFYVVMFSDDLDEVPESDETNNHGTGYLIDYDDFATPPDLVGTYCNAIPNLVTWGENFALDYTVLNQGSADAGAFDIGFYLSEDTDYDMGVDSFLSAVSVSQLTAGASTSGTATITLPSSSPFTAQTGTFYVMMFSDDLDVVVESDETNNHSMGYQIDYDQITIPSLDLVAHNPTPANGAIHENTWAMLSWEAGDTAVSHDIYVGESFTNVQNGTGGTFRGNQTATFYYVGIPGFPYPGGLVPGTTYFWRVDEIEADGEAIHTGFVWSFTTAIV